MRLSLAPRAHYNRGSALAGMGEWERAKRDYDAALALDPMMAEAYHNRANAERQLGDLVGALKDHDKAVGLASGAKLALAYTERARTRRDLGDLSGARADIRQAIARAPDDAEIRKLADSLGEAHADANIATGAASAPQRLAEALPAEDEWKTEVIPAGGSTVAVRRPAVPPKSVDESTMMTTGSIPNGADQIAENEVPALRGTTADRERTGQSGPAPSGPSAGGPPNAGASGDFRVQIGSFRSPDEATRAWERATGAAKPGSPGEALAGLQPFIAEADIPNKGVFYRLQVGPFPDRASALSKCEDLKTRKMDCLVVGP